MIKIDLVLTVAILIVSCSLLCPTLLYCKADLDGASLALTDSSRFVEVDDSRVVLPVIMYHSVNVANIGSYVISPEELEKDFANVKRLGYTPILASEAVTYTRGRTESFPKKPILITFDDGFYNNYTFVLPLLKKYGFKAVIAVVGSFTDNERGQRQSNYYSNLNRKQICELYESGLVEIANHTYDLHGFKNGRKGVSRRQNEDFAEYSRALTADLCKTQTLIFECTGKKATVFAYPYGIYDEKTVEVLENCGFEIALTCNERVNVLYYGCNLMEIGRFNRFGREKSDVFFEKIEKSRNAAAASIRTDNSNLKKKKNS